MLILSLPAVLLSVCAVNAHYESAQSSFLSLWKFASKQGLQRSVDYECLGCICDTETACNHSAQCHTDPQAGIVCGPYQVPQPYFQDCCRFLSMTNCDSASVWQSCALDYNCATRCVQAYVNTYGSSCSGQSNPTCDVYARVHKGGANGCHSNSTNGFANAVMNCYGINHFLYPCKTDTDCKNQYHNCDKQGSNPNCWFCNCGMNTNCMKNADCCSNICQSDGTCQFGGGGAGTVCNDAVGAICAPGCRCMPCSSYGYCEC